MFAVVSSGITDPLLQSLQIFPKKLVLENIALMAAHMPCRSQKYSSNVDTMSHHALYMR